MGWGHLNNGADVRPYVAALLDNLLGSQTLALGPAPGEVGLAGSLWPDLHVAGYFDPPFINNQFDLLQHQVPLDHAWDNIKYFIIIGFLIFFRCFHMSVF